MQISFIPFSFVYYTVGLIIFVEEHFKYFIKGLSKILTNSFFNFGFPKIIRSGKHMHPNVIPTGEKKYNFFSLFEFCEEIEKIITIAKNNAEPKDTVYLLLIEAALFTGAVESDRCLCSLLCLYSKYFKTVLIAI